MGKVQRSIVAVLLGTTVIATAKAAAPLGDYLFVSTINATTGSGSAATMELVSPWNRQVGVEPIAGNAVVRAAFGKIYVVDRVGGTIQVIDAATLDTDIQFIPSEGPIPQGRSPQDIMVVSPTKAYVTRRDSTQLYRVDPTTGIGQDVVDLSVYADDDGLPEMSMMARDGDYLFIQMQRVDFTRFRFDDAYLAIVDLTNEKLERRRLTPAALPGIPLDGLNPSFKMQVDSSNRMLYVSMPGDRNDFSFAKTGIEAVDLDLWQSKGFIITENQLGADVGGFVVVSPTKGYCIAHTDIVASSHLRVFEPGVGQIGELIAALFSTVDSLEHDAATSQLFFPDASSRASKGIRVYDTNTDLELTAGSLPVGGAPMDMTIVRAQQ